MNRDREAQETRSRPSVWPVYLAAGVIVTLSLMVALIRPLASLLGIIPYLLWAASGLLAACGVTRLRAWGWRCAVVWAVIGFGWLVFACTIVLEHISAVSGFAWLGLALFLLFPALFLLVISALVVRRCVSFPPGRQKRTVNLTVWWAWALLIWLGLMFVIATAVEVGERAVGEVWAKRSGQCLSNLMQLGLTIQLYAEDNEGKLPPVSSWREALLPYANYDEHRLVCPTTKKPYVFNDALASRNINQITDPGKVPVAWDALIHDKHGPLHPGLHVLFLDGHAQWLPEDEFRQLLDLQDGVHVAPE